MKWQVHRPISLATNSSQRDVVAFWQLSVCKCKQTIKQWRNGHIVDEYENSNRTMSVGVINFQTEVEGNDGWRDREGGRINGHVLALPRRFSHIPPTPF